MTFHIFKGECNVHILRISKNTPSDIIIQLQDEDDLNHLFSSLPENKNMLVKCERIKQNETEYLQVVSFSEFTEASEPLNDDDFYHLS